MDLIFGFRQISRSLALAGGALLYAASAQAIDLTFDISDYAYEETDPDGGFLMQEDSKPAFFSLGARDWRRPAENHKFGYMYTGELTAGRTAYNGKNAGIMRKMYYKARAEAYLTYRLSDYFTPFAGIGYRFLHDDSGGQYPSVGGVSYDRDNHLVYLPLGMRIDPMKNLSFKAQFNAVLHGWQISYTSDGGTGYPDAHNQQDKGWGIDITGDYRMNEKWSIYSFFRYWDIDRSDNDCGDVTGQGYVCWAEPSNTTREIGIGVSYRF